MATKQDLFAMNPLIKFFLVEILIIDLLALNVKIVTPSNKLPSLVKIVFVILVELLLQIFDLLILSLGDLMIYITFISLLLFPKSFVDFLELIVALFLFSPR